MKMIANVAPIAFAIVIAAIPVSVGLYQKQMTTSPIALEDIPTPNIKPDPALVPRPVSALSVSDAAVELIMENEGLALKPYRFRNAWYIGYGHGRTARADMTITPDQARELLVEDLSRFEKDVRRLVKVPLTEGQFSALVSFVYNVGPGRFARSSVLTHINNGEMERAADALMLYTKARVGGQYRELRSLVERRTRERDLFLGPLIEEEKPISA